MKLTERNKYFKKSISIYELDLYIDGSRLLRVRGQLNQSTIDEIVKHSLLISKGSMLARLIIKWCHEKVAYSGWGITLYQIRSSAFWIINCNATDHSFQDAFPEDAKGELSSYKRWLLYQGIECVKSHLLPTVVLTFLVDCCERRV